jgi:hypothetical protein
VAPVVGPGVLGAPPWREIEERSGGEDGDWLLTRMRRRGLLMKIRDGSLRGDPNLYRLTAVALGAMGHATLESFQTWCQALASGRSEAGPYAPGSATDLATREPFSADGPEIAGPYARVSL